MSEQNEKPGFDPYEFIHEYIDSVPHLEALILFWNSRPVGWTSEDLSSRLYIPAEQVNGVIRDLVRLQIVQEHPGPPPRYSYFSRSDEQNEMMTLVDGAYRRDLVRISTMVHSKASSPVREFVRAFKFRKERDQ
jgi:hypothetical protein